MSGTRRLRLVLTILLPLLIAAQAPASALIRYIAFGDSISSGIGDPEDKGYPIRLKRLLEKQQSEDIQVVKSAIPGEETSEALARIDSALSKGGDAVLLMEGTNDISRIIDGQLSLETVIANLDALALAAKRRGTEPIQIDLWPGKGHGNHLRSNLGRQRGPLRSHRKAGEHLLRQCFVTSCIELSRCHRVIKINGFQLHTQ